MHQAQANRRLTCAGVKRPSRCAFLPDHSRRRSIAAPFPREANPQFCIPRKTARPLEDLFLATEDLFRLGNSTDPKLTHVRHPKDVDTREINGIQIVIANGKGISLVTRQRLQSSPVAGWVWRVPKGTAMPGGLRLINDRPGHYALCPIQNMPMDEFKGLLSKLALRCERLHKQQVSNG